jgi:hypothetical protein
VPEQNHAAMRAAAERPVSGPAATDVLAAGGGLDVPGREPDASTAPFVGLDRHEAHEPIPGEYDATTLTHREPGAMGGSFNGADNVSGSSATTAAERTLRERIREGGGRDAERLADRHNTPEDR